MGPFIICSMCAVLGTLLGWLSHKMFGKKNPTNCDHEFIQDKQITTLMCFKCGCKGRLAGYDDLYPGGQEITLKQLRGEKD
jgi:hypothetical protein